jgi:Mg-chelatase subunit ChlI
VEQLIGEAFNPFVKSSKENKYPPTIKVKIPYENSKYNIKIEDMNTNEEYDFNEIKDKLKGAYVKICFRVTSVYFINKAFGVSAKATKIKISFPSQDEDDFRSDSEDETTVANKMSSAVVEDDDIDDEIRKEVSKKDTSAKNTPKDTVKDTPKDTIKDSEDEDDDDDDDDDDQKSNKKDSDEDDNSENSDDSEEPVKPVIKKVPVKSKVSKKK